MRLRKGWRAGTSVVVNGRKQERVDEAVRPMRRSFPGSEISGVAADLSTAERANTYFVRAPDDDILVNNVGTAVVRDYNGVADIANIPDEDWLGLFQLNVMRGVGMTRHHAQRMVANMIVYVCSE